MYEVDYDALSSDQFDIVSKNDLRKSENHDNLPYNPLT